MKTLKINECKLIDIHSNVHNENITINNIIEKIDYCIEKLKEKRKKKNG